MDKAGTLLYLSYKTFMKNLKDKKKKSLLELFVTK